VGFDESIALLELFSAVTYWEICEVPAGGAWRAFVGDVEGDGLDFRADVDAMTGLVHDLTRIVVEKMASVVREPLAFPVGDLACQVSLGPATRA
jgi:hypothetical protein